MIRDFEYLSPKTLEEALAFLSQYQDECKIIAGGQSLLILMRQGLIAPEYLVDIKGITELNYVQAEAKAGLRIGALTPHRAIEKSPLMKNSFSVLAEMEHRLASIQTRNWGTIGGNLCHADPAGDPTSVLMALNATVTTASVKGKRTMAVEDFCKDYFETALQHDELLVEIQVPPAPPHTGAAYTKFNIIETDMAMVAVAVSITLGTSKDVCQDARIVLGACASTQLRAKKAEEVLRGKKITAGLLKEAGQVASQEADPISDVTASEEYRRELVKVLVPRVGQKALDRARQA
ncbi:MAG: xanthine dehydrogenase family protein subunit M [Chloroflexi bacterium]|nr:xanthine dehydrogenase family protein subunit M [Chloroflexota bacterium]